MNELDLTQELFKLCEKIADLRYNSYMSLRRSKQCGLESKWVVSFGADNSVNAIGETLGKAMINIVGYVFETEWNR